LIRLIRGLATSVAGVVFDSVDTPFAFPGDSFVSFSLAGERRSFFTLTSFFLSLPSLRSLRMSRAFCFLAFESRLEELEEGSRFSFFFTFCLRSLSFFLRRGESLEELLEEELEEEEEEEEEKEEEEEEGERRRFSLLFSSSICLASSRWSSSRFLSA